MARETIENLRAKLAIAETDIAEFKKKFESAKSSLEAYQRMHADAAKELEDLHIMLDFLPHAPEREKKGEESWNRTKIPLISRMAIFFSNRSST